MMTKETRLFSGIIILTVPTIAYGGYFLLSVLSGQQDHLELTEFQKSMFRAGHAHAGVLVMFSLIAQVFIDELSYNNILKWVTRVSIPTSAILISGGFFASAMGDHINEPNNMIYILFIGVFVLVLGLVLLGIGLIRSKR